MAVTECLSCGSSTVPSPMGDGMFACSLSGMRADIRADDSTRAHMRCDRTKEQAAAAKA